MKKLTTNFKGETAHAKLNTIKMSTRKRRQSKNNNPYPESGLPVSTAAAADAAAVVQTNSHQSLSTARSAVTSSQTSMEPGASGRASGEGHPPPTPAGARSMAPTIYTDLEASQSVTAPSHGASSLAGTSRTANGGLDSRRGGDSTFSSPAPSVRSLTTTLTTIQSLGPNGGNNHNNNNPSHTLNHHATSVSSPGAAPQAHQAHHRPSGHLAASSQIMHFNQPFPTASPAPASAIPPHLTPAVTANASGGGHPATYHTATANNLLTDNASILTLASSTQRRRRRSFDTDASVRALAPSSIFGGSRESLPLSVLSASVEQSAGGPSTPGLARGGGGAAGERASLYSSTGVGGVLASERNSFYAKPALGNSGAAVGVASSLGPAGGDGASIRSVGLLGGGHGPADSVSGSIGGGLAAPSPLTSPKEDEANEMGGMKGERPGK